MNAVERAELQRKVANLPRRPGVYLFKNSAGTIIYVGKGKILRNRVRSYFGARPAAESPKVKAMVSKIAYLETIVTDSEVEALILEANLVKEYRPQYNITLRDDKSFPYIRVTAEPFPRIFPTRKIVQDGSRYFGPYTDASSMRDLLKTIKRIFPVRSCNYFLSAEIIAQKKYKLCLDYHIKRCLGPCEGLLSQEDYRKIIEYVVSFIDGHSNALVADLEARMEKLASQLRFEEAARLRDMLSSIHEFQDKRKMVSRDVQDRDILVAEIDGDDSCGVIFKVREGKIIGRQHFYMSGAAGESIEHVTTSFLKQYYLKSSYVPPEIFLAETIEDSEEIRQWLAEKSGGEIRVVVPDQKSSEAKLVAMSKRNARLLLEELKLQRLSAEQYTPKTVQQLQADLRLKDPPHVIEAFDISNISGKEPVASMVYFINGKPLKKEYRHYKIRGLASPNDYAMMREVLERRYARKIREKSEFPDLILVDGGKGQLTIAVSVLRELKLNIPVIALAKRLDEVFMPGHSDAQNIAKGSPGLRLLQRIRDESHRFAVQFHRSLRRKRTLRSALEEIPGVGPQRRKALFSVFDSLQGIREATADELADVEGISQTMAETIWSYFHVAEKGDVTDSENDMPTRKSSEID